MIKKKKEFSKNKLFTILYYLVFVGSGLRIVLHFINIIIELNSSEKYSPVLEKILDFARVNRLYSDKMFEKMIPVIGKFITTYKENVVFFSITSLVLGIALFYSVFLLKKMKRQGFILYSVFRILILLSPFVFFGVHYITILIISYGAIIPICFILIFGWLIYFHENKYR